MPKRFPPCVYCPTGVGTTEDHIPPQSLFAKPRPSNMIKVPCCEECRVRDGKDDEFVLHLFTSLATTEIHPSVMKELAITRNRAFDKFRGKAKKLMAITVNTPRGPAFNLDHPSVDRFLKRACRAILYDGFGLTYFHCLFRWKLADNDAPRFFKNPPAECASKSVGDTFGYIAVPPAAHPKYHLGMSFYDGLYTIAELTPL